MLWSDIQRLGNALQDNRTIQQKAAAQRNLVPLPGPSPEDEKLAFYRKAVRDEKLMKMTPAERKLAEYEEYLASRDEPKPEKPKANGAKQEMVWALLEKIVSDPKRPRADFEAAMQTYEQYGAGMDWKVADEWYDALAGHQQKYLLAKQGEMHQQRAALQQQIEQLNSQMGEFLPSASLVEKRINLLNGYANNSAKPLPDGITHDEVAAARESLANGDSSAAVDLITRASETIDQWQASIGEAS